MCATIVSSEFVSPTLRLRAKTIPASDMMAISRATANIDDHVPSGLVHRQPHANGRSHWLFDQVNFASPSVGCRILTLASRLR